MDGWKSVRCQWLLHGLEMAVDYVLICSTDSKPVQTIIILIVKSKLPVNVFRREYSLRCMKKSSSNICQYGVLVLLPF